MSACIVSRGESVHMLLSHQDSVVWSICVTQVICKTFYSLHEQICQLHCNKKKPGHNCIHLFKTWDLTGLKDRVVYIVSAAGSKKSASLSQINGSAI